MKTTIRILCLLLAAALLMGAAPGGNTEKKSFHFDADFSSESLEDAIERYLGERLLNGNNVTIGWYELTSGEEWYRGGDTFLEGASTYKLPLSMIYADKINARFSVVLGDNEIAENKAKVKNMGSGEQTELLLDESFAEKFSVLSLTSNAAFAEL